MHLSGTRVMLGLMGTPVEHSKSPAMYNHCFAKYGLDWAYLAFNVTPEQAGAAVQAIRTLNMRGANVTMPCKSAVIPYLDKLSPEAQAIGAVNVIVNDGGVLTGYNTDGMGYALVDGSTGSLRGYDNIVLAMGSRSNTALKDTAEKVAGQVLVIGEAAKAPGNAVLATGDALEAALKI